MTSLISHERKKNRSIFLPLRVLSYNSVRSFVKKYHEKQREIPPHAATSCFIQTQARQSGFLEAAGAILQPFPFSSP